MHTLQNQLVKYRSFISDIRHTKTDQQQEKKMQTEVNSSRSTGGQGANKRYKRTPEELDQDIAKVDELVATGKYNQIEALHKMNLQSSVYHYRKRQQRAEPAKSLKPRKFAHRVRANKVEFTQKKDHVMKQIEAKKPINTKMPVNREKLELRLEEIRKKYEMLKEFVTIEARYKELKKQIEENEILG